MTTYNILPQKAACVNRRFVFQLKNKLPLKVGALCDIMKTKYRKGV